jgi:hypothetical protein
MSRQKKQPPRRRRTKAERDHRATILNRTSDAFWRSRGYPGRPVDWRTAEPRHQKSRPKKSH